MTIAEHVAQIDNRLAGAHLVLLDLASGHPVKGDSDAVKAALADLEAAREMLYGLAVGPGQNGLRFEGIHPGTIPGTVGQTQGQVKQPPASAT